MCHNISHGKSRLVPGTGPAVPGKMTGLYTVCYLPGSKWSCGGTGVPAS